MLPYGATNTPVEISVGGKPRVTEVCTSPRFPQLSAADMVGKAI